MNECLPAFERDAIDLSQSFDILLFAIHDRREIRSRQFEIFHQLSEVEVWHLPKIAKRVKSLFSPAICFSPVKDCYPAQCKMHAIVAFAGLLTDIHRWTI